MCNVIVVQGDHGMWSWRGECRGEWGCKRVGVSVGMCMHPGMRSQGVTAVYSWARALFNF